MVSTNRSATPRRRFPISAVQPGSEDTDRNPEPGCHLSHCFGLVTNVPIGPASRVG